MGKDDITEDGIEAWVFLRNEDLLNGTTTEAAEFLEEF